MRAIFTVLFLLLLVNLASAAVVINEVYFIPISGSNSDEWIELYNNDSLNPVNISGWNIKDYTGNDYTFPENSTIVEYLFLDYNRTRIGLNNDLESLNLTDNLGNVQDFASYSLTSAQQSEKNQFYARIHDGSNYLLTLYHNFSTPTPGAANNQIPTAFNDTAVTSDSTLVSIDVLANDLDADNDTLIVTSANNGTNGTTSTNGTVIFYTPTTGFSGTDSFNYTISDGFGGTAAATVTVTVNHVNSAPTAQDQTVTTNEEISTSITLNASDPENSPLNWSILTQPQNGNLTGTAPNLAYAPNLNFNGQDNFTFKVIDNQGTESNTATISITVTPVNDAPTATSNTYNISEDNSVNITLAATDVDSSNLTYIITNSSHGTFFNGTGNSLTYTPTTNYNGTDSFTFTVTDGVLSDTATITLNIASVNDAPVATNQTFTINEDTFQDITFSGTDVDGDSLNYSIATNPAHGTFNGTRYLPALNYNGTDFFTFRATDGTLSSIGIINLTITQVNDAPNITSTPPATATQSVTSTYTISATDVENDNRSIDLLASTFKGESFSNNAQIKVDGLQINFTPQNAGKTPVKIVVTDGANPTTQEFNLSVLPVLDLTQLKIGKAGALGTYAPDASTDPFNPLDNLTFQLTIQNRYIASGAYITKIGVSAEQDGLTGFPVVNLEKTYLNPQEVETAVFSYQIPYNLDSGNYTLTFSVSGTDLSNRTYTTERIVHLIVDRIPHSITITEVAADTPVTCEQKQSVPLVITVANTGTYDEDVVLAVKNLDLNVSSTLQDTIIKGETSEFTFDLDLQQVVGEIAFTIEASKADLPIPEYQSVRTIRLVADNCAPGFQNLADTFTLTEDQPSTVNLTSYISNPETTQSLTLSASRAQNITVTISGKRITFTPLVNWYGEEKINLTVSDGINSTTQEVRIVVNQNTTDDQPTLTTASTTIPTLIKYNADLITINTTIQNPDQQSPTYEWFINNTKQATGASSFSFSGTSLGLGDHTIKLAFNNGQTNRTWTIQVADRPVDASSFNVNVSGDITNLANFTLSNTKGRIVFLEVVDLTNILKLSDVVSIETNKVTVNSAALNKPARITLQGQFTSPVVMKSTDGNTFTICPETECQIISNSNSVVTFTVTHFSTYSLQEAGSLLLSVTTTEIEPRTNNDIKVKVTNTYTQEVEDIVVTARLLDVDGDELEEESKEFSLSPQASKEVTIEFDLTTETLDEDSYTLEVIAEGSADSEQVGQTTKILQVQRESHEIIIRNLELSSDNLDCSGSTSLRVTLENIGTRDEDKIGLSVQNAALGINLARANLELDDYSGAAERSVDFNFNINKAVNGQYPLEVAVTRDGHLETSKDVTLTVNCPVTEVAQTTTPTYSTPVESFEIQGGYFPTLQTQGTPVEATPIKTTFRDSDTYLTLMGIMIVLLFLAIALGLVVLMKKRD